MKKATLTNKLRSTRLNATAAMFLALGSQLSLNAAVTVSDNFESSFGNTTPGEFDNFTFVDTSGGSNAGKYSLGTGSNGAGGNSGSGASVGPGITAPNGVNEAGAWLQANTTINSNSNFTVSFDFRVNQEATFDDVQILFGDIDGGDYYLLGFGENIVSNQMFFLDNNVRDNTAIADDYGTILDDTWYSAKIEWDSPTNQLNITYGPTGTLLGMPNINLILEGNATNDISLKDLGDGNTQFGFGTFNDNATYDNIVFDVTAVPEPKTYALLLGLAAASLVASQRRTKK